MKRLACNVGALEPGITTAAAIVKAGGCVVFPTESVYGLAADPTLPEALTRLGRIKGRDAHKPVALIAADVANAARVGQLAGPLALLAGAFWPGPLTLALTPPPGAHWHPSLVSPEGTVGVRVSSHPVARALARAAGGLVTATSANAGGQPPGDTVDACGAEFLAQIDLALDAGQLPQALPSTVVGLVDHKVTILRPGAIGRDALREVCKVAVGGAL